MSGRDATAGTKRQRADGEGGSGAAAPATSTSLRGTFIRDCTYLFDIKNTMI